MKPSKALGNLVVVVTFGVSITAAPFIPWAHGSTARPYDRPYMPTFSSRIDATYAPTHAHIPLSSAPIRPSFISSSSSPPRPSTPPSSSSPPTTATTTPYAPFCPHPYTISTPTRSFHPKWLPPPPSPNWRRPAPRRGVHGTMVREQQARIRVRIAQPDTAGRRHADETDPVRHGADKGLRGNGEELGIPRARCRGRARRRGRGVGARGRRTGRPARKRATVVWASRRGGGRRRSKAVLEWAASSPWELFVKRFEAHDDSDSWGADET